MDRETVSDLPNCPQCNGEYTYEDGAMFVCPECAHEWEIRTVIDGTTEGTLGNGVYTHPDISYDCSKIVFCYKATPTGSTMIYEIDIDGKNLHRITDPTPCLADYKGSKHGIHDLSPTYLPDGRIVFLSTRPSGLVNGCGAGWTGAS